MPLQFDQDDIVSLALCAWKEARGDGVAAMTAVMFVVLNRATSHGLGFPSGIHDVIYAKNQFTSMSVPNDPEFNLVPPSGDVQYMGCLAIAPKVLDGTFGPDPTFGAHYYCNQLEVHSVWFEMAIVDNVQEHPFLVQIGRQRFYR